MEPGSSSNQFHGSSSTIQSNSDLVVHDTGNVGNNMVDNSNVNNIVPNRRDPDLLMPTANIVRIMRRVLPQHAKISDEAKALIQECVSEYVSFITGEANEHSHHEHRKTVTAEDILYAHVRLGFDNYVGPLTLFLNRYRHNEASRSTLPGDPSVLRTTYFPDVRMQTAPPPPPLLIPRPPPFPTFQVTDQQGLFFQSAPSSADGGFAGGSGASSAAPSPGFYPPDRE